VENELENMFKEAVGAKFQVLSRYSPEVTERNRNNMSQDSLFPAEIRNQRLLLAWANFVSILVSVLLSAYHQHNEMV
jgi:hypothetical protein